MFKQFIEDAKSIAERDPAATSVLEVIFLYSGFHAVCLHRIATGFTKGTCVLLRGSFPSLTDF